MAVVIFVSTTWAFTDNIICGITSRQFRKKQKIENLNYLDKLQIYTLSYYNLNSMCIWFSRYNITLLILEWNFKHVNVKSIG